MAEHLRVFRHVGFFVFPARHVRDEKLEPATGNVMRVFPTGRAVQRFLLTHGVPASSWSSNELRGRS